MFAQVSKFVKLSGTNQFCLCGTKFSPLRTQAVEEDFVSMRKTDTSMTADKFHHLLCLARYTVEPLIMDTLKSGQPPYN